MDPNLSAAAMTVPGLLRDVPPTRAASVATDPIGVLFVEYMDAVVTRQSIHAALMRSFDPGRVACHVAYNRTAPELLSRTPGGTAPLEALEALPGVTLHPVELGPAPGTGSPLALAARALLATAPALRGGMRMAAEIERHRIGVIHCAENARSAVYAHWLARRTGAKMVVHLHALYGDWINPLARRAIQQADGVITVSRWAEDHARRHGVAGDRIFTVYNGIDTDMFDPAVVDGAPVRREFGIDGRTSLLVSIGGLRPTKGQALLLHALHRVVRTHPDTHLLIVGTEDAVLDTPRGVYTEGLRSLARELGLSDRVTFTGARRDVRNLLAAADIFTLPAFEETFGLVFVEAMAMQTPVVAASSGGVPEVVVDGETGLLAAPDDPGQLAAHIVALLDAPARRREMGIAGRRRACARFTVARMANSAEDVYRAVSSRRAVSPRRAGARSDALAR